MSGRLLCKQSTASEFLWSAFASASCAAYPLGKHAVRFLYAKVDSAQRRACGCSCQKGPRACLASPSCHSAACLTRIGACRAVCVFEIAGAGAGSQSASGEGVVQAASISDSSSSSQSSSQSAIVSASVSCSADAEVSITGGTAYDSFTSAWTGMQLFFTQVSVECTASKCWLAKHSLL